MACVIDIYFKHNLKNYIVDLMLEAGYDDFFYHECAKYVSMNQLTESEEQVSGRQKYGLIKILLDDDRARSLTEKIHSEYGTQDVKIFNTGYRWVC